ncbi:hydratase [Agaribacterium sp. ZY112]|uniref:hydratase n=1 Tax=Agaribacterium sp. ZY112 TaxID=3233574 RepID=UPI0035255497
MNAESASKIATSLLNGRVVATKQARFEEALRVQNVDEALAVQTAMASLRDDDIAAWKCLLPPADDAVVVAPIFANTKQSGDVCKLIPDDNKVRIEPEIAFVLSEDLPAQEQPRSEEEISAAFGKAHMALELMQDRWSDAAELAFCEKLADGLFNQGIYLGPEIDLEQGKVASSFKLSLQQADTLQAFDGKHPNPQAFAPILWLINYMCARGTSFKKGQAFITGSFCGIVELAFDVPARICYEGLGEYEVSFSAVESV